MEVLPDRTMVSTTYCVLEPGQQPLVVSVRFTMEDIGRGGGIVGGGAYESAGMWL